MRTKQRQVDIFDKRRQTPTFMLVGKNCRQTRRHEAVESFAALNKGVTKLSEKRRKPLEIGRGIKRKKREGKWKEWEKTSWQGWKREKEKRENETEGKAEMKWGEAWLVRGVPPRHSLLINQPPTTLSREPIFLLRTYPPRSLSRERSFCCILVFLSLGYPVVILLGRIRLLDILIKVIGLHHRVTLRD